MKDLSAIPSPTVNPNLTCQTFSYKDILVGKLVRAVACSILSQIIILLIYITVANLHLQPGLWISSILSTFTRLSTWIFAIIFLLIIFAQCLICAKDYVLMNSYCSTRFQQLLRVLSLHNFSLLSLHVILGGAFTWQILVTVDSSLSSFTVDCEKGACFVADSFFLILGGFWTGFYFFLKIYLSTKEISFPVIQQSKFLQFRNNISILFKESTRQSIWPTLYFIVFYYLFGGFLEEHFMFIVNLDKAPEQSSILIYVYLWWFSLLYCFSMNLMRFFFCLFLTEVVQFPLVKENEYVLTLQEAILMDSLPIVQNLACLDLFLLAQSSPLRRQFFFTLSQPGGHPHNWNSLIENVLKIFVDYTNLLKKTTEVGVQEVKKVEPQIFQTKYSSLRNMSLHSDMFEVVDIPPTKLQCKIEELKQSVNGKIDRFFGFLRMIFGINYFFGELPQVNIQKCLGNGQLIVWASQGLTELVVASLNEDRFGVVQKDIPCIVNSLVQLKQSLDKLQKGPRKLDCNNKMKNAIVAAVKRSLFNLCLNFGEYFNDLSLSKDVMHYLQCNVMLKNDVIKR